MSPRQESTEPAGGEGRAGRESPRQVKSLTEFLTAPTRRLPPLIDVNTAAARIIELHEGTGGATFNLYFGDLAGQPLYSVSLYPERAMMVSGQRIAADVLAAFVSANLDLLQDPRNSVGTWYNEADDVTYLDISAVLPDRQKAEALSRRYNQIAAFDLARLEIIDTGGTGTPVPDLPPLTERLPKLRGTRGRRGRRA